MEEGFLVGRNLHPWIVLPLDVDFSWCGGGRTLTLATSGWLLWLLLALAHALSLLFPLTTIRVMLL
eukprot:724495-Ditylum_brightwellii.AAC.1